MTEEHDVDSQRKEADNKPAKVPVVQPTHTEPANDDADRKQAKWYTKTNWDRSLRIIGLVIGSVVCFIYWQQLQVMTGQLQQMEGSSTQSAHLIVNAANQANATRDAAESALKQAIASNDIARQAKRSSDIAERAERPWLGYEMLHVKTDVATGSFIPSSLVIKNWGRGPAVHAEIEYRMKAYCGEAFPQHPAFLRIEEHNYFSLMPGQNTDTKEIRFPKDTTLSEADMEALKAGKCVLYAYARIHYLDTFGRRHWRHMCGQWQPSTPRTFLGCPTYNDGDEDYKDGKEP